MKKILPFLLAILMQQSCCIVHKTFSQSDRIDTQRPKTPIIECIPCYGLRNVNENFTYVEALGTSGSYSAGIELGHNFNNIRMYGAASASYWPWQAPNATFTAQFGLVGLNPNFIIRPEFGISLSEWIISGNPDQKIPLHPAMKKVMVEKGNYPSWAPYGGIRLAFPESSLNISLRIYRLNTLKPKDYSAWYPGIVFGCRF